MIIQLLHAFACNIQNCCPLFALDNLLERFSLTYQKEMDINASNAFSDVEKPFLFSDLAALKPPN